MKEIRHPAACACQSDAADWYHRYAYTIRCYLMSRTGDAAVADDCLSETFLRALARRHTFRCRGDGPRPWLFTIARNVAHDYRKHACRRHETLTDVFADSTDPAPGPEETVVRRDNVDELYRWVDQLPEDQARCVRLRFLAGMSVVQTARALHRKDNAIRALQYRAVRRLMQILSEQDHGADHLLLRGAG